MRKGKHCYEALFQGRKYTYPIYIYIYTNNGHTTVLKKITWLKENAVYMSIDFRKVLVLVYKLSESIAG